MEKWLLISNCQTEGLKNSLTLRSPGLQVEALDIWSFLASTRSWSEEMPAYDRVVAATQVIQMRPDSFVHVGKLSKIPNFMFRAFHPDVCYVQAGDEPLFSPLHDYYSAICAAAYKAGYSAQDTAALYNQDVYESLGFFSLWDAERDAITQEYKAEGIDIRRPFLDWSRLPTPFMHVFNHPNISVIYDLAGAILNSLGVECQTLNFLPPDNLANASIFPVYPEIAERYGYAGGAYRFKPHSTYTTLSLGEYVAGCFAYLSKHDRAAITSASPQFAAAYELFSES
ncbi:WcbI family polysaccharide biosynthesis putative acetyltransferase [Methylobacterium aquaticum]|uniref:WcbI family polysaccharide biosynthesis putative acetyltransferase n=1 Tax=Methylobacterium aquaticum TaxID=270351 RepID=UPI0019325966|nr:WcbI family polysaccharide biosynthesis putative acetyltransferase [Methylobacterium aquaticum]QRE73030.1 hypothetical protein F1D61_04535 [Methylobacterium aquaticum]